MDGTAALINSLARTAQAAFAAGDYDAAISAAAQVQALIMGTPNVSRSLSGGNQSISWPGGGTVSAFIALCRQLKTQAMITANGVFQQSHIVYERPTTLESDDL